MIHSLLYVPADRPERLASARARRGPDAPDALIVDLEDGVAPSAKEAARAALSALADHAGDGPRVFVRVNRSGDGPDGRDVAAVAALPVDGLYLPKATLPALEATVALLDRAGRPDLDVVALVESARGLLDAADLAGHPRVVRLAIGEADLTAELGISPGAGGAEVAPLRLHLVVASAAAGIDPPTGPVATDFRDLGGLRRSSQALARLGFGGRATIHPDQVGVVNEVFRPSEEEVAAARALVDLFDRRVRGGEGAVVGPDGTMLDEAVVRRARRLLSD